MKKLTLLMATIATTLFSFGQFNLISPADNAALNVEGNGNNELNIKWNKSSLTGALTYTWHLDLPTGNFNNPIVSIPANNSGADTTLTLTLSAVKGVLEGAGVPLNQSANLKWTVTATNGTSTVFAASPFDITLTNGVVARNFDLSFPTNGFAATVEGDGDAELNITWRSAGEGVTYAWFLDLANANYSSPIVGPMMSNNGGNDTVLTLDFRTIDAVLAGAGVTNGTTANLQWKVHAYAGNDSLPSTTSYTIDLTKGVILDKFDHIGPANNLSATIEGKSTQTLDVTWNSAGQGAIYEWYLDLASGDFSNPLAGPIMSNNMGADTVLTLDYATINSVLEGAGVAVGNTANLKWIVKAKTGGATLDANSSSALNLQNGAVIDNFSLVAPATGFEAEIANDATQDITITWNSAGEGATYTWFLTAASASYNDALVNGLASNNNGNDTALTLDFATVYSLLEGANVAPGATATLKWKVHAYGGTDSIPSSDFEIKLTRGITSGLNSLESSQDTPVFYPNPVSASGSLNLSGLNGISTVQVIDLAGNTVQIANPTAETMNLDFNEINSGLYFIQFVGNEVNYTERLVVE